MAFKWISFASICLALAAVVVSQSPPKPSPSFSTKYVTAWTTHHHNGTDVGTLYEDFANQRQRDNTAWQGTPVDIFSYFARDNQTAYVHITGRSQCTSHKIQGPMENRWQWVNDAQASGSCTVGSTSGQQWTTKHGELTLSGCFTGNTPLQVTSSISHDSQTVMTFAYFNGTSPDPSVFNLDPACWNS